MADRTRELLLELVKLRSSWESRLVEVRTGELTTTLFLNFGEIAAVKASKPGDPIGRILLRKGLISREHYVEVLERLGEVLSTGERVAFGEVAVGLGYVKAEDVSASLTAQVRELATRVFQGGDTEWTVSPLPDNRDPSRDLTLRVEAVFLDTMREADDARRGALGLDAARPLALRPTWTLQEIDVRFELTADEADFVREALAGDKTVEQVLATTADAALDRQAVLTALIASGAVESRAIVAAERHDKPEARTAPPPLPAWTTVDATKAKEAAETAVRVRRAQAPPKLGTSSPLAQLLRAEQTFERGREALVRGDLKVALTELESALTLHPGSSEYDLFVRWCRHRIAGGELTAAERTELEARAREALRENAQFAIAHFVLSAVYESSGRTEEARTERSRARGLDRELVEAMLTARAAAPAAKAPAPAAAAVAPVAARGPASPSAKGAQAAPKGAPIGPRLAVAAVAVALAVGGAIALQHRSGGTHPAPTASSAPAPVAPPPSAATTATAAAGTTPDASVRGSGPRSDAGTTTDAGATHAVDATHGVIHLPKWALGHRIFVDGKTEPSETEPFILRCGHHDIRIGSQGQVRSVDVPCGGEIDLH